MRIGFEPKYACISELVVNSRSLSPAMIHGGVRLGRRGNVPFWDIECGRKHLGSQ